MLINPQWNVWQRIPFSREVISQSGTFQPSKRWYHPKWNMKYPEKLNPQKDYHLQTFQNCLKFSQFCQPSNQTSEKRRWDQKLISQKTHFPNLKKNSLQFPFVWVTRYTIPLFLLAMWRFWISKLARLCTAPCAALRSPRIMAFHPGWVKAYCWWLKSG